MFTLEDWIVDIAFLLIVVGGITGLVAATIPAYITTWVGLILLTIGIIMLITVLLVHFWKMMFFNKRTIKHGIKNKRRNNLRYRH